MSQIITYELDDGTTVGFEVEPTGQEFQNASPDEVFGKIAKAVQPAIDGALVVLEKVKKAAPDEVEIKFGVKASGDVNWLVARAATEGNFEITLTWKRAQ